MKKELIETKCNYLNFIKIEENIINANFIIKGIYSKTNTIEIDYYHNINNKYIEICIEKNTGNLYIIDLFAEFNDNDFYKLTKELTKPNKNRMGIQLEGFLERKTIKEAKLFNTLKNAIKILKKENIEVDTIQRALSILAWR